MDMMPDFFFGREKVMWLQIWRDLYDYASIPGRLHTVSYIWALDTTQRGMPFLGPSAQNADPFYATKLYLST